MILSSLETPWAEPTNFAQGEIVYILQHDRLLERYENLDAHSSHQPRRVTRSANPFLMSLFSMSPISLHVSLRLPTAVSSTRMALVSTTSNASSTIAIGTSRALGSVVLPQPASTTHKAY